MPEDAEGAAGTKVDCPEGTAGTDNSFSIARHNPEAAAAIFVLAKYGSRNAVTYYIGQKKGIYFFTKEKININLNNRKLPLFRPEKCS